MLLSFAMTICILKSDLHPKTSVDPFGQLPCTHDKVRVYITNGESLGDDLVECNECDLVVTMRDLYAAVRMPTIGAKTS